MTSSLMTAPPSVYNPEPPTSSQQRGLLGEGSDRILAFETFPVAVQALIAGDVDGVILDDVAGIGYVGANPDAVRILDGSLTATEELGFIFPLGQ